MFGKKLAKLHVAKALQNITTELEGEINKKKEMLWLCAEPVNHLKWNVVVSGFWLPFLFDLFVRLLSLPPLLTPCSAVSSPRISLNLLHLILRLFLLPHPSTFLFPFHICPSV